jgi:hypothetical protein
MPPINNANGMYYDYEVDEYMEYEGDEYMEYEGVEPYSGTGGHEANPSTNLAPSTTAFENGTVDPPLQDQDGQFGFPTDRA